MSEQPTSETEWVPAFKGQRPPFAVGHELSVRHGAHSRRHVVPRAERKAAELRANYPHLAGPRFAEAVERYAEAAAQLELLVEHLGDGLLDDKGRPKGAADLWIRLHRLLMDMRSRLGLDPRTAAQIERDLAAADPAAYDAARRRAREELERRQAEHAADNGAGGDGRVG